MLDAAGGGKRQAQNHGQGQQQPQTVLGQVHEVAAAVIVGASQPSGPIEQEAGGGQQQVEGHAADGTGKEVLLILAAAGRPHQGHEGGHGQQEEEQGQGIDSVAQGVGQMYRLLDEGVAVGHRQFRGQICFYAAPGRVDSIRLDSGLLQIIRGRHFSLRILRFDRRGFVRRSLVRRCVFVIRRQLRGYRPLLRQRVLPQQEIRRLRPLFAALRVGGDHAAVFVRQLIAQVGAVGGPLLVDLSFALPEILFRDAAQIALHLTGGLGLHQDLLRLAVNAFAGDKGGPVNAGDKGQSAEQADQKGYYFAG